MKNILKTGSLLAIVFTGSLSFGMQLPEHPDASAQSDKLNGLTDELFCRAADHNTPSFVQIVIMAVEAGLHIDTQWTRKCLPARFKNYENWTLLHFAAMHGDINSVRELLGLGAKKNLTDTQ